jgi:uncharacterized membrane protein YedE/YeeE
LNKSSSGDILEALYRKGNPVVKILTPSSQVALLVFAGIFLILGGMIGSPDGRLFALVIAGLCTLPVLISGSSGIQRILAIIFLAAVVFQAIPAWRQHRNDSHNRKLRLNSEMKTRSLSENYDMPRSERRVGRCEAVRRSHLSA